MKGTKIVVSGQDAAAYSGPLLVCFVGEVHDGPPRCSELVADTVADLAALGDFTGKKEQTALLYPDHCRLGDSITAHRLLLVGLGSLTDEAAGEQFNETLRCAGGVVATIARQVKATDIGIVPPPVLDMAPVQGIEQLCEGILLGDYQFRKYKKDKDDEPPFPGITSVTLFAAGIRGARTAVKRATVAAMATRAARDMAHEPGSAWTPEQFAAFARKLAKRDDMKCTILEKSHLLKAGLGGLLAVNRGSATPPKLIVLEYAPKKAGGTVLLVGKGITFDSGGVSLKPAAGMQDMKYDMCGGAAVLAVMQALAEERPDVRVIGMVPATDNMSGAAALKPGDIITHYGGITSEVINTDAEGRLILADALAYGIDTYRPDCVIDLATLTGAVIIGLGHHHTGLFSNDDRLAELLYHAGERCAEPLWRMPLGVEYSKQLESEVADIKNMGGKEGGAIVAAAYLEKFVGKTPWAHLDIAGTAWDFTKKSYIPKGPSGIGVRTLLTLLRNWQGLDHATQN